MKKRIFSGIKPTGNTHLGNYIGAIRHWVTLQNRFEAIFCIADLHAITYPIDPLFLKSNIRRLAAILIAAGIDPAQSSIFIQSHISAHTELAWILNCVTPYGWMQRMTQFKDKFSKGEKDVSLGLFNYPVLMASDILVYRTDFVPVGDDQRQHLELARDIAVRFNRIYGKIFNIPEPYIAETGARIMKLDNPVKKMSKSENDHNNTVYLLDSPDEIRAKIMRAKTDSHREIRFDDERPEIHNLLVIYEHLTGMKRSEIESQFSGHGYQDFKNELAEVIINHLQPLQLRYRSLMKDPGYIDQLLDKGAGEVRPIAEKTLADVKTGVGLG